jgi:hypothetical protein
VLAIWSPHLKRVGSGNSAELSMEGHGGGRGGGAKERQVDAEGDSGINILCFRNFVI